MTKISTRVAILVAALVLANASAVAGSNNTQTTTNDSEISNHTILALSEPCSGETADSTFQLCLNVAGFLYCFYAIAIICDEYFVPALELMADKWNLSPDVAGATLMAAGGSAPELFTALIGTSQKSTIGFSTIVGSAVFNVLFVIAMCVLFQKEVLQLTSWPLIRDCTYYIISLSALSVFFSVISPGEIEWWEATVLFCMYFFYVFIMKNNSTIRDWLINHNLIPDQISLAKNTVTFRVGVLSLLYRKSNGFADGISAKVVGEITGDVNDTFDSIDTNKNGTIDQKEFGKLIQKLSTEDHSDQQIMDLFSSIDTDGNQEIDHDEFSRWYLASTQRMETDTRRIFEDIAKSSPGETISSNDISALLSTLSDNVSQETIHNAMGEFGDIESASITYEAFLEWYKKSILWENAKNKAEQEAKTSEGVDISFPESGFFSRLLWILGLPIFACFKLTVPDVQRTGMEKWKYITFFMSIMWIGFISFWMVTWVEVVGNTVGIPVNVMGITILAAGTSVPDLLSSVVVARQGHGDMAISSSIGSNIFDILVGLPIPWLIFSLLWSSNIEVQANNLEVSIFVLIGMVLIVVASIHQCDWRTEKKLGLMMLVFYGVFLCQDLLRSEWSC